MAAYSVSQIGFTQRKRATLAAPASYWLMLVFLGLLYANLPMVMPALNVLHLERGVGVVALAALFAEMAFAHRSFELGGPAGWSLLAFLCAGAFSCVTALWPRYAAESAGDLAKMALIFFFIANCANTERRLRGVMWTLVIGGLFPAAGTLRNFLHHNVEEGRAAWVGIFANPNEVAYSLVVLLPLAAVLARGLRPLPRLALLGAALVWVAAILVTFSRGGLVGLVAAMGIYAWRKRSVVLQASMALLVVGGMIFAGSFWTRAQNFEDLSQDVTFRQRLATTQAGVEMFEDHPFLGVGLGCSVIAWPLYAPEDLYTRDALVTHNTFIQALGETGAAGFIPFMLFVGFGAYYARKVALQSPVRSLGHLSMGIEVAIWGLVVCGMSGGYVLTWFPYILLGLAAAARQIEVKSQ